MTNHFIFRTFFFALTICFLSGCGAPVWQKADLAERQGNLDSAASELESYILQNPTDARAYYQLGEIRAQQKRWDEMLIALKTCDDLSDRWQMETANSREFYWTENINAGIHRQEAAEAGQAISHFQTAIKILPQNAAGHRLLGEAFLQSHQPAAAISAFENALQFDPDDRRARRLIMRLYFGDKNYAASLNAAQYLQKHGSQDVETLRYLAYSLDKLDDRPAAITAYEALIKQSGDVRDVEAFAAFQFRCGEYETAVDLSRIAISGDNALRNLRAIAQMQLMMKDYAGVAITAEEILAIAPDDRAALALKQVSHAALGEQQALDIISHRIQEQKDDQE